jgi:hypothetical protein
VVIMVALSLRLTFRYDDDGLHLVARTPRGTPPPPSEPVSAEPPPGAIVLELRAATGEVRYRRFLIDPIPQTLEAGTPDGGFQRFDHAKPSGSFSAVVPTPEDGAIIVVSVGPAVRFAQPGLRPEPGPAHWRELLRTGMGLS